MYVRFSVPLTFTIADLSSLANNFRPVGLIFKDLYFYADIPSGLLWKLQGLKAEGRIVNYWFIDFIDDLPVGVSDDGT